VIADAGPDQPMTVELAQPSRTMSMNDRLHWRARHRLTKAWRNAAHVAALEQLGTSPSARRRQPCMVRIDFPVRAPGARRDPHNLAPTIKACIDGLVDAGVWSDDTDEFVVVLDPRFHKAEQPAPLVRIHLIPRADQPGAAA
jgi:crossover junction endodeoxyribonuclease RusA